MFNIGGFILYSQHKPRDRAHEISPTSVAGVAMKWSRVIVGPFGHFLTTERDGRMKTGASSYAVGPARPPVAWVVVIVPVAVLGRASPAHAGTAANFGLHPKRHTAPKRALGWTPAPKFIAN